MSPDSMDERWFDQQFPMNAPLVILHPNFTRQHLYLPEILEQQDKTVIFLSIQQPASNSETLWDLLGRALADQFDLSIPAYSASPNKAAQSFLKTLKAVEPYMFILDN